MTPSSHIRIHDDLMRRYVAPPRAHWYWRWSTGREAIVWLDGQTIAFREELIALLERHVDRGLPPLECVVLLLAATRESWPQARDQLDPDAYRTRSAIRSLGRSQQAMEILTGLDAVHALPESLRESVEAKAELGAVVFEKFCKRTTPQTAAAIIKVLSEGPSDDLLAPMSSGAQVVHFLESVSEPFCRGLATVDEESLRLRRKTGLEQLPTPADESLELMPSERARALIAELQDDVELGGLARVARNLMAAVYVPRQVSDQDDLPLGGISDLTNRGELDRLLLSELAYDDLTLAVRVALKEALYLHRETPPRNPPARRALLLDAGIRMWGVPRVFAAAVGLALTATSDRRAEVLAYRACQSRAVPIDLTTREGLIEHLAVLEPSPHPGAAIEQFLAAATRDKAPIDCIVVTSADVLTDWDFQKLLCQAASAAIFVVSVSREGHFRIELRGPHRNRCLREAQLDLDKLLAPTPRSVTPLIDRGLDQSLPVILSTEPFPLRLIVHPRDENQIWSVQQYGALAVTKDRRLVHWDQTDLGASQIAENIPKGIVHWANPVARHKRSHAVVGHTHPPKLHLLTIDLETRQCTARELVTDSVGGYCVCHHNGALFVLSGWRQRHVVETYRLEDGQRLDKRTLPESLDWQSGRFYRKSFPRQRLRGGSQEKWYALSFDGAHATIEEVTCGTGGSLPKLITLFDWVNHDGPMGVSPQGELYCTATGQSTRPHPPLASKNITVTAIARDGAYLRVQCPDPRGPSHRAESMVIDTETGTVFPSCLSLGEVVNAPGVIEDFRRKYPTHPVPCSAILRWQFRGLVADESGCLFLIARDGATWAMTIDDTSDDLVFRLKDDSMSMAAAQRFERVAAWPKSGYRLRVAKWADGSRAYLDSRGMLHLVSSASTIPETTIVLVHGGSLAGWCSDGRLWGPAYFTGGHSGVAPQVVFREVLQPFALSVHRA